jgi:hypothetical protein
VRIELPFCRRTRWSGRNAYELGNGAIRLTTLTGGGHIAAMRIDSEDGSVSTNPLWMPPWATIDPHNYREPRHRRRFGTLTEGKLLSGIAGHNLCLDYFGIPSPEEVDQGLSLHGEAPSSPWRIANIFRTAASVACELAVTLPVAGLDVRRTITLRRGEHVAYFTEAVRNQRKADHFFHWTQHVTLGPPFLARQDVAVSLPGTRGMTFPHGYDEGKALLASNREFQWPEAPRADGGRVDLTRTLIEPGLGFVVGVQLAERDFGFIAAVNRRLRVMLAYCFRRTDYPWVAVWEENRAISAAPWKSRTEARGLEFGTTPLPISRRDALLTPHLFGEPTMTFVPARGRKVVHYAAILCTVPGEFDSVRDIAIDDEGFRVFGESDRSFVIRSPGVRRWMARSAP